MIKAVLFDMDGLVLDSETLYDKAMINASEKVGWPMDINFLNLTRGVNGNTFSDMVFQAYGSEFPLEIFRNIYKEEFYKIIDYEGIKVKKGFYNLMSFLELNHIKHCLVTSSTRKVTNHLLKCAGLSEVFLCKVCGDEVLYSKPDPYIYLKACKEMEAAPETCMVLEDSKNGIIAGKSAGCITVLVPDITKPDHSMIEKSDFVVNDLEEVIPLISMVQDRDHC